MGAFADLPELERLRIWDGVLARAVHGERVSFSVVELDAGSVIPVHYHENEQVGMLVQGSMTFRIGEETREVRAGMTWCIPANTPHEVATGPEGAVAIEVFAPPRDDWSALGRTGLGRPRWP